MTKKQSGKRKRRVPKTVLRLPDLDQAKSAVLNSLSSIDAQRGHRHAIEEFIGWYCSEPQLSFSETVVLRYRIHLESRHLAPGTINLRLGAVRRLAYEASDCGLLSPDLTAGTRRVKGVKKIGVRLGNWLTPEQSQRLWNAPDSQLLKGKRDRALLAVLLACGLRRHEAVNLVLMPADTIRAILLPVGGPLAKNSSFGCRIAPLNGAGFWQDDPIRVAEKGEQNSPRNLRDKTCIQLTGMTEPEMRTH